MILPEIQFIYGLLWGFAVSGVFAATVAAIRRRLAARRMIEVPAVLTNRK